MPSQLHSPRFRFAEYELDVRTGELKKSGHKIPLPSQAIQLLALLLERAGDVVTREELYAALWPTGTVVEFDHGINSSIRRLRAALNDSADRPRYIETLPKRGYRFIFPVKAGERDPAHIETETRAIVKEHSEISGLRRGWLWAAGGAFAICILIGFGLMQWRTARGQSIDSIAVLPLVNATNDASAEYLSDGIAEEIINALSTAPRLKVIARTSAFRFKGKEVDPRRAGRELGVGAVLTGTLARHGDELVIQTLGVVGHANQPAARTITDSAG